MKSARISHAENSSKKDCILRNPTLESVFVCGVVVVAPGGSGTKNVDTCALPKLG